MGGLTGADRSGEAERAAGEILSLPMFPHLTEGQQVLVVQALHDAVEG